MEHDQQGEVGIVSVRCTECNLSEGSYHHKPSWECNIGPRGQCTNPDSHHPFVASKITLANRKDDIDWKERYHQLIEACFDRYGTLPPGEYIIQRTIQINRKG
jgi:hypothetical protein